MIFWRILVKMNVSAWYLRQWWLIRKLYPEIAVAVDFNKPDQWHKEIEKIIEDEFVKMNKTNLPELGFWEALTHLVLARQAWSRGEFNLTLHTATKMQEILDDKKTIFSDWLMPHAKTWQAIGALMVASCDVSKNEKEKQELKTLGMFWANMAIDLDKKTRNKWMDSDKILLSTTVIKTNPETDIELWNGIRSELALKKKKMMS